MTTCVAESDVFMFSHDAARILKSVYLGSGTHAIAGFVNLDKDADGAIWWEWGSGFHLKTAAAILF